MKNRICRFKATRNKILIRGASCGLVDRLLVYFGVAELAYGSYGSALCD